MVEAVFLWVKILVLIADAVFILKAKFFDKNTQESIWWLLVFCILAFG